RGDALVTPGSFPRSYRLDVALDELEPIRHGERVHVHHGTSEIPARVVRFGERYAQLRLAEQAVAARGDRVVLRTHTTVGGGRRHSADPLDPGVDAPAGPWAPAIVPLVGLERQGSRLYLPGGRRQLDARAEEVAALERELDEAGFIGVKVADARLARALEERD